MTDATDIEYSPIEVFASPTRGGTPATVFGSPGRYVQGDGVIDHAGHYLCRQGFASALVLASARSFAAEGARLMSSLAAAEVRAVPAEFAGECSFEEIDRHVTAARALTDPCDVVVAIGGGKAVDAGRAIADRLDVESVIVPSLASNDAPTAALSVIYSPEGVTVDAEVYARNPALVLMDTGIVAQAGERYLAAGMADSMATWFEARATARSGHGVNVFGGRPTRVATAIARLCRETLLEHGRAAIADVREGRVSEALEAVVEANTLMSGLGYESGGLAAAHAVAQGFTVLDAVHRNKLHGEMVAMGTLTQLLLEDDLAEARNIATFFAAVGLPVTLAGLGVERDDAESLAAVVGGALSFPFLGNMHPHTVDKEALHRALLDADALGATITAESFG